MRFNRSHLKKDLKIVITAYVWKQHRKFVGVPGYISGNSRPKIKESKRSKLNSRSEALTTGVLRNLMNRDKKVNATMRESIVDVDIMMAHGSVHRRYVYGMTSQSVLFTLGLVLCGQIVHSSEFVLLLNSPGGQVTHCQQHFDIRCVTL